MRNSEVTRNEDGISQVKFTFTIHSLDEEPEFQKDDILISDVAIHASPLERFVACCRFYQFLIFGLRQSVTRVPPPLDVF